MHVLTGGYADMSPTPWSVASTVTYIRDGDTHVVVDPGLVRSRDSILAPLRELGVQPEDITDVIFSHHHPDHTVNAALFREARIHDHMAVYREDTWLPRPAEGFEISGSILAHEVPALREALLDVRGVKGVFEQLEVHEEPHHAPPLQ